MKKYISQRKRNVEVNFAPKDKFTQKKVELKLTKMWLQNSNFLGEIAHDLFGHHTKLSNMRSLVAICFCPNQKVVNCNIRIDRLCLPI